MITGNNNENKIPYEGTVTYDVRFYVWVPDKAEMIKIIVDVEAQKTFYPGYDLATRAVFYASRMLSAQMGTEFTTNYDDMKKVYSIWICMNAPRRLANTITEISLNQTVICGSPVELGRYDLLGVVFVTLSQELTIEKDDLKLHRLLGAVFSHELSVESKKEILKDLNIKMSADLERSVNIMCNLSDIIFEESMEKGLRQGYEKGIRQGLEDGRELGLVQGLEQGLEQGLQQGLQEGLKQGELLMLYKLIRNKRLTEETAAEQLGLDKQQFIEKLKEHGII